MRLGMMHPHIMQGRTVVESLTWRGVRHGIVPRCLSGLQWPLIQVRSKGHEFERIENETRLNAA